MKSHLNLFPAPGPLRHARRQAHAGEQIIVGIQRTVANSSGNAVFTDAEIQFSPTKFYRARTQ